MEVQITLFAFAYRAVNLHRDSIVLMRNVTIKLRKKKDRLQDEQGTRKAVKRGPKQSPYSGSLFEDEYLLRHRPKAELEFYDMGSVLIDDTWQTLDYHESASLMCLTPQGTNNPLEWSYAILDDVWEGLTNTILSVPANQRANYFRRIEYADSWKKWLDIVSYNSASNYKRYAIAEDDQRGNAPDDGSLFGGFESGLTHTPEWSSSNKLKDIAKKHLRVVNSIWYEAFDTGDLLQFRTTLEPDYAADPTIFDATKGPAKVYLMPKLHLELTDEFLYGIGHNLDTRQLLGLYTMSPLPRSLGFEFLSAIESTQAVFSAIVAERAASGKILRGDGFHTPPSMYCYVDSFSAYSGLLGGYDYGGVSPFRGLRWTMGESEIPHQGTLAAIIVQGSNTYYVWHKNRTEYYSGYYYNIQAVALDGSGVMWIP